MNVPGVGKIELQKLRGDSTIRITCRRRRAQGGQGAAANHCNKIQYNFDFELSPQERQGAGDGALSSRGGGAAAALLRNNPVHCRVKKQRTEAHGHAVVFW